jgi:hypothetical protein
MSSHCIKKNIQKTSYSAWRSPQLTQATGENFGRHIKRDVEMTETYTFTANQVLLA